MILNREPSDVIHRKILIAVLTLGVLPYTPSLRAQSADKGDATRLPLPIKNTRFVAASGEKDTVEDWVFEAVKLIGNAGARTAKLQVKPKGEAELVIPKEEDGVILRGSTDTARGDLVSAPVGLRPFRWVEATVEYAVEAGEPGLFVCLRPTEQRSLVDLAFLPRGLPGKKSSATVRLHTGLMQGDYSLSVSILGKGSARILSIEAYEAGPYPRLEKPVFVLDILHTRPRKDGLGWKDAEKFVTVFGFPSVEYLHYTEVTREKLDAIDPALIVLSPKSEPMNRSQMDTVVGAVRIAVKQGAPVLGICLGHQALAMMYPDTVGDRGMEWGPTRIGVVKDDSIFEGLPRYPYFYLSESHVGCVADAFRGTEIIASSDVCRTQIFRYGRRPWYTFQGHIERGWEDSCPEAYLILKNLLRGWNLAS